MLPSVLLLMRQPDFHLRLRAGAEPGSDRLSDPLAWVHSSDLEDPTPWLAPGGLLLTDGTQFDAESGAVRTRRYVDRLADASVAGLGFATGVVHPEIPPHLLDACDRRELPLLEVADRTPFMAIIRFVADVAARDQRERLEWSLAALRGVARAALRPDGLNAVLLELERRLGCWVALFDAAGQPVAVRTRRAVPAELAVEVQQAVDAALARGSGGGVRLSSGDGDVTLQTLGQHRRLRGVLAVGTRTPLDHAGHDLMAGVIALASIALDQSRTIEDARHRLRSGLLQLMLAGAVEVANDSAEELWGRLPPAPVRICVLDRPPAVRALLTELELHAERHPGRLFFAEHGEEVVAVCRSDDTAELRRILRRHGAPAGCSTPVLWSDLPVGLTEARRCAARADADRSFVCFDELVSDGMLGLLEASGGAAVATRMLRPLQTRPEGERAVLTQTLRVWFEHRCSWDPAAKQLGVHRHTLRNRIGTVERLLGLDLDAFGDRAELWSALQLVLGPALGDA